MSDGLAIQSVSGYLVVATCQLGEQVLIQPLTIDDLEGWLISATTCHQCAEEECILCSTLGTLFESYELLTSLFALR